MIYIEEWESTHPRWHELAEFVEQQNQHNWVNFHAAWHQSSHLSVALQNDEIVGFIRFVVQAIGADEDLPIVQLCGAPLHEAKILAFAVAETHQRQGIGRRLQDAVIEWAQQAGLYQVRSHSSGTNKANHQLKLAMGFAVFPIERGADREGAYFILPLRMPKFG